MDAGPEFVGKVSRVAQERRVDGGQPINANPDLDAPAGLTVVGRVGIGIVGQGVEAMAHGQLDISLDFAAHLVTVIDAGQPLTVLSGACRLLRIVRGAKASGTDRPAARETFAGSFRVSRKDITNVPVVWSTAICGSNFGRVPSEKLSTGSPNWSASSFTLVKGDQLDPPSSECISTM